MNEKKLLTPTEVGNRVGLSAKVLNELLYENKIIRKRGRRSKKNSEKWKAYWYLDDPRFGQNFKNHFGNTIKYYKNMIPTLFKEIGVGGAL